MISLGLYSYIPSLLQQTIGTPHTILYLWFWGIGGVIAHFSSGIVIDKTGKPKLLMIGILIILTLTLFLLPTGLSFNEPWTFLPFIIWGAMGWSYLPSQQHILFSLNYSNGAIAIALNSSFNYLGSSVGTFLGGLLLVLGFTPLQLPYFSAGVCFIILLIQIFLTFNVRSP